MVVKGLDAQSVADARETLHLFAPEGKAPHLFHPVAYSSDQLALDGAL
jgi:hypothetical protein